MPRRLPPLLLLPVLAVLAITLPPGGTARADDTPDRPAGPAARTVDPRWLDRLDDLDRALLDELVGSAPPAFAADLTWVESPRRTWEDLRGRVVVIQTWTSQTAAGRKAPERVARALDDFEADDLQVIFLHTPEGRDRVQRFLDQRAPAERAPAHTVVVDPTGAFCDALGAYQRPVNVVIGRNGATRYVGLNTRGLTAAVADLVAEPHDPGAAPPPPRAPAEPAAFPPITGSVGKAIDFRGKPAPDFTVERWWTNKPDAANKVVVLDFWATWCGPCIAAIPHMNDLADRFRDDVCVIGISREEVDKFDTGLARIRRAREFRYALALDPSGTMQRAIGIRAIPHCVVISRDWVVRWQGHPARLTPAIVQQIVAADTGGDPRRLRWTR